MVCGHLKEYVRIVEVGEIRAMEPFVMDDIEDAT
jgi:hypothetical protein